MLTDLDEVLVGSGEHVVHFYEREETLALAVGSYLGAGLVQGERALVVATAGHRAAFERALAGAGVDLPQLVETGRYVALDAETVLGELLVDGRPDEARFRAVVGGVIRTLGAGGTPVRVFGDMVDLLWQRGAVDDALALEDMWNALRSDTVVFTLFCGYASEAVSRGPGPDPIVARHTGVVRAPEPPVVADDQAVRGFEPTPSAARVARHFVAEVLQEWGRGELVDTTSLVVGELVGNAIRHSRRRFRVTVQCYEDALRVAVTDPSPAVPSLRVAGEEATDGRGLHLIAALARRWGTEVHDGGKTVWAELPAAADDRSATA